VATIRERLDELKSNPRNRRCREVITLLEAIGAKRRPKPGSDHVYTYPGVSMILTLPCHNPGQVLLHYAMKKAIQFIEEVLEQVEAEGEPQQRREEP
jgi:hypothetical protein